MPINNKKTKYISLMTYAQENDIKRILNEKSAQLENAFYIYHDKDESEPHYHIVIELKTDRAIKEIISWFKKCNDINGNTVNTFGETVISCAAIAEYLTHTGIGQETKHQYKLEDIKEPIGKIDNFRQSKSDYEIKKQANNKRIEKADNNEKLLDDLIEGLPCREMARRYGRDFMKNHKAYREYAAMVVIEEDGDLEKACKIASNGFEYLRQEAERAAFEDGVITALTRVYDIVVDEENGYCKSTIKDIKNIYKKMTTRKE